MMYNITQLLLVIWFPISVLGDKRTPVESLEQSQYNINKIAHGNYKRENQSSQELKNTIIEEKNHLLTAQRKQSHSGNISRRIRRNGYDRDVSRQDERELIVGGIFSPIYRYPYMVTIRYSRENSSTISHSCGGTLIAPDVVLTAAHCYNPQWGLPQVIVGDFDLKNSDDGGELFDAEVLAVHPEWKELIVMNDIMLLQLKGGQSTHAPVKLNTDSNVPSSANEQVTVVGWGSTDPNGVNIADKLSEATLEYIPMSTCGRPSTVICAQDLDGVHNEDACKGDSGGPLLIKGTNVGEDTQIGLVSAGPFPCNKPSPGLYVRISEYIPWIAQNVCSSSISPPSYFQCDGINHTTTPSFSSSPTIQHSLSISPTTSGMYFTLMIQLDSNPGDVIWGIYKGISTTAVVSNLNGYQDEKKNQTVYETFALRPNQDFRFIIYDRRNDGLCCHHGNGHYALYYGTGSNVFDDKYKIFQGGGNFGNFMIHAFRSIALTKTPSLMPSMLLSPTKNASPSISNNFPTSKAPSIAIATSTPSSERWFLKQDKTPSLSISPSTNPTISISLPPSNNPTISISLPPSNNPTISISLPPSNNPTISISLPPSNNPTISISLPPSSTPSIAVATSIPSSKNVLINQVESPTPPISKNKLLKTVASSSPSYYPKKSNLAISIVIIGIAYWLF